MTKVGAARLAETVSPSCVVTEATTPAIGRDDPRVAELRAGVGEVRLGLVDGGRATAKARSARSSSLGETSAAAASSRLRARSARA